MVSYSNYRKILLMIAGLIMMCLSNKQVFAQPLELLTVSDTSYFISGEDDWNLVESVIRSNHSSVLLLLKRGADPDAKAEGGMSALMFAAEIGDTMLVKLLVLNGADLELTQVEGTTPLLVAVLNQHFRVAQYLLEKGANPNHQDDYKGNGLLYAAAMNDYQMADLLLYYDASDTIRDSDGNTALMTAVFFGNTETVDVLLQNSLGPDGTDKNKNTPLMIAAQQGNKDIITLLLEYGAELEKVNTQNYTALAHAIQYQQDSAAMVLMDSGANIHHQITNNRNLYDLAVQRNRKVIRQLLTNKGAKPLLRPDFSAIDVGWGNSFGKNEHLMQARVSWVDRKFGFFAETGIDVRPVLRKVQVTENNTLIYQYRESRLIWTHGVGKYFRLAQDKSGMDYGVYGGIYGMLSFPKYRGIQDNPPIKYNLAPSAGIYMSGKIAGIKAGAERYNFGTLHERSWKINITLFFRISYQSTDHGYKDIQY